jgi:hypothetical protein
MIKTDIAVFSVFALILSLSLASAMDYDYYVQHDVPTDYASPVTYSNDYIQPYVSSFSRPYVSSFSRPSFSSNYNSQAHYSESPGYTQFPDSSYNQKASANSFSSNQDSSNYKYDYRGPMYEKKFVQVDDFLHDTSSKTGFFNSRSNNVLKHTISTTLTEKYLGATESVLYNTQNNRYATQSAQQDTSYNYDGGFSFGKQRVYDSSEYSSDSYREPYYYRPYFDSQQGYYSWKY